MRDIEFFDNVADYESHIWESVFTESWVYDTPFYRNLVHFILDHRTPIFYTVSDSSEHFAFSGAYYFETRRTRYPSKTREQLFWLHDFTHMLFPYAHDVYDITERKFLNQFWYQERIASSETEIMAYWRVPGLRKEVFPDEKLWYDVLVDPDQTHVRHALFGQSKPDTVDFLSYRVAVQMNDNFGESELGDYPEILKFVQQWRRLTPKWISRRYRSVAGMRVEVPPYDWNFNAENYERRISAYSLGVRPSYGEERQENYERNIMANVRMAYDLLGWGGKPERWRHMPEAIDRLEGAVLLK